MNIIRKIAIEFAYHFLPNLYKKRFFKSLQSLKNGNPYLCEPELQLLDSLLNENAVFLDIGTNKGIYLYQAQKVIKNGVIIGFEPNSEMVKFSKKLFKNIPIHPIAISSKTGTAILHIPYMNETLKDTRASLNNNDDNTKKIEIQTQTLDNWLENNHQDKIDLIKVDVEGHELDVIKGAIKSLKEYKPKLIVEIELRHSNYPIFEIFELLESINYETHIFDRKLKKIIPFNFHDIATIQKQEDIGSYENYINNFIFVHKII